MTRQRQRLLILVTILWTASVTAAPDATARGVDFDPASDAWNGLGYLLETAHEANVHVEVSDRLDWAEISADEVLFVVAPHVGPNGDGGALRQFIRAGGRMLLADDFRAGDRWLRPFGMQLLQRPGPAKRHAAGVRHLPELAGGAELGGFLGFHVQRVVLNHPAALIATPGHSWRHRPLGRFSDGVRSWAMEAWRPGQQGRVLAIADPSMLINTMVRRFYGNKQASANLLRYFCFEGERCRVRLLANLRHVEGRFTPKTTASGLDVRHKLRAWVDGLASLLAQPTLRPLWWLLVVLAFVAPMLRGAKLPIAVLPPPAPDRGNQGRMRHTVQAWLARPDADYRRPARQLAHHLTRTVELADGRPATDGPNAPLVPLQVAIDRLVRRGHLAAGAGQRILDLVGVLEAVQLAEPVHRERFTQLAAEVEWAEQVLSHTTPSRRRS